MDFEILTTNEAAAMARITPRFLQKKIRAGEGPVLTRIGRRVLVRSDLLQDWLECCTNAEARDAH